MIWDMQLDQQRCTMPAASIKGGKYEGALMWEIMAWNHNVHADCWLHMASKITIYLGRDGDTETMKTLHNAS